MGVTPSRLTPDEAARRFGDLLGGGGKSKTYQHFHTLEGVWRPEFAYEATGLVLIGYRLFPPRKRVPPPRPPFTRAST
jgi:hypothetical protein